MRTGSLPEARRSEVPVFQNEARWLVLESSGNVDEGLRLVPIKGLGPSSQSPVGDGRRVERSFPKVGQWELIGWGAELGVVWLAMEGEVALILSRNGEPGRWRMVLELRTIK